MQTRRENMEEKLAKRKTIRLRNYDYAAAGFYFVTVCTHNRARLFGDIVNDSMQMNDVGKMVDCIWNKLPEHFSNIKLDEFVVMPNHVHGIIQIICHESIGSGDCRGNPCGCPQKERAGTRPAPTIGDIVGAFKSITTCKYIDGVKRFGWLPFESRLWQRNYYEHIIRNESELHEVREYIRDNPLKWAFDPENIAAKVAIEK